MALTAAERKRKQAERGGTDASRLRVEVMKAASKALTEWLKDSRKNPRLSDLVQIARGVSQVEPPPADHTTAPEGTRQDPDPEKAMHDLRRRFPIAAQPTG